MSKQNVFDGSTSSLDLPTWAQWKGPDTPPASWWAVNPETGERTKVYRSYEDYCDD